MDPDISLGQIEDDKNYNFTKKYDEEGDIFNSHSCKYFEIYEMKRNFLNMTNNFSTYSHNVRSLNGHWDNILDIIYSADPIKFSVLAFQEI